MINGPNDVSFGESVRLSRERPIGDGAPIVSHVVRFEDKPRLIHPLDLHPTITINRKVHRS